MENIAILREIMKPEEEIHTHISVVFIKGDLVYKIKKPVNFGFLDFSTLEKRKFYAEEEVRLNRRLSPDIYLGVEEIRDSNGNIIDYAVIMKRLPMENSLKNLILSGLVTEEHIEIAVRKIAEFHKNAETNEYIAEFGKMENFRRNIDENFEQVERYVGVTIDKGDFDRIRELTEKAIRLLTDKVNIRAQSGYVKSCHGDLHSEHIVFDRENCYIIDCIEFNERFRFIDILCDIAFLLMDLDYLGRRDLGKYALKRYIDILSQKDSTDLINLFKSYRAFVRGKVNSLMVEDPNIVNKVEVIERAKKYFDLAKSYLEEFA
mgnify:CR=1 FL=1